MALPVRLRRRIVHATAQHLHARRDHAAANPFIEDAHADAAVEIAKPSQLAVHVDDRLGSDDDGQGAEPEEAGRDPHGACLRIHRSHEPLDPADEATSALLARKRSRRQGVHRSGEDIGEGHRDHRDDQERDQPPGDRGRAFRLNRPACRRPESSLPNSHSRGLLYTRSRQRQAEYLSTRNVALRTPDRLPYDRDAPGSRSGAPTVDISE